MVTYVYQNNGGSTVADIGGEAAGDQSGYQSLSADGIAIGARVMMEMEKGGYVRVYKLNKNESDPLPEAIQIGGDIDGEGR